MMTEPFSTAIMHQQLPRITAALPTHLCLSACSSAFQSSSVMGGGRASCSNDTAGKKLRRYDVVLLLCGLHRPGVLLASTKPTDTPLRAALLPGPVNL